MCVKILEVVYKYEKVQMKLRVQMLMIRMMATLDLKLTKVFRFNRYKNQQISKKQGIPKYIIKILVKRIWHELLTYGYS